MYRPHTVLAAALVLASARAFSQPELPCTTGPLPAATLLFPYFEVDTDDPAGKTTLISIRNVSEEPALVNVVVWSRCTVPVLDFPLLLKGRAVQSLDLRRLLVEGKVPATGADFAGPEFPGCSRPLAVPELDGAALGALRATLVGHTASPACEAAASLVAGPVVGFVTVDALNDCSDTLHTPLDEGYFAAGGNGLASDANVLSGDSMLLEGRHTSTAVAIDAVSVVADAARFAAGFPQSFYAGFSSDRLPLDSGYNSRFLNGAGPGTTTDFIVWLNPFVRGPRIVVLTGLEFFDEQGRTAGFFPDGGEVWTPSRYAVGELLVYPTPFTPAEPLDAVAGSVEIHATWDECPVCAPTLFHPHQMWSMPLVSASGGLSVGLRTVQRTPVCGPGAAVPKS